MGLQRIGGRRLDWGGLWAGGEVVIVGGLSGDEAGTDTLVVFVK